MFIQELKKKSEIKREDLKEDSDCEWAKVVKEPL